MANERNGDFVTFVADRCEIRQVETIKECDLWAAYERWCRRQKLRPFRRAHLWDWLKANLPAPTVKKVWQKNVAYYIGIKVKG